MAFTGLGAQTKNFGSASQLPPGMGGPVMRRPGNGTGGKLTQQDEATRLAMQFPGASQSDLDSTAGAEMGQRQYDRSQAMLPHQPDPLLLSSGNPNALDQNPATNPMLQEASADALGMAPPIHRAFGGPTRRTRQFAQGTAAIPYGNRGQEMVTGGTGALPALPGRIGYRGALQAAPSEQEGAGLDWLKQGAAQADQNSGARNEIDPVTGLSRNPTEAEINAQLHMLSQKGDEFGLPAGFGGSVQRNALARVYDARRSGDPDAIAQAEAAASKLKNDMKNARNTVSAGATGTPVGAQAAIGDPNATTATQTPPNPAANGGNGTMPAGGLGQTVPPPAILGASAGASAAVGAPTDAPAFPTGPPLSTDARKKGGPVANVHPYIVNEKGVEAFKPKGGKPELMPGPEHMTTFSQNGTVIPHGRTMKMLSKGMIQPTEGNPETPIVPPRPSRANTKAFLPPTEADPQNPIISPVGHDADGKTSIRASHWWNRIPWSPEPQYTTDPSPEQLHGPILPRVEPSLFPANSPLGRTGSFIQKGLNSAVDNTVAAAKWPFTDPQAAPEFQSGPAWNPNTLGDESPDSQYDNYDSEVNTLVPETPFPTGPAFHPGEEESPIASTKEGSNWLDSALQNFRAGKQQAQNIAAPLVQAKQAIMQEPGVSSLPSPARTAGFLTPYGTASVSNGPPTAGPHVFNADGSAWIPPARRIGGKVSRTKAFAMK